MLKFHFFHSKLRKQLFFAKPLMRKRHISKSREGPMPPSDPLPTPVQGKCWRIHTMADINLRFKLRVEVGANEIQSCT